MTSVRRSFLIASVALSGMAHAGVARADAPSLGLKLDVGVPSGAAGSLVYRPVRALRVHAGGGHNLVAPGVHAGVTLAPLATVIAPTLVLDAGRFFPGDVDEAIDRVAGDGTSTGMPDRFGYDFASAHLGLEIGGDRVSFYLHGGVSYVRADVETLADADDGSSTTTSDVDLRLLGVSARLGFILYFAG